MLVMDEGIFTEVRDEHPEKHFSPMLVMDEGMSIDLRDEHP